MTDRLAAEVAGFGPDVVVLEPQALGDAVVRRLAAVHDRHTGQPGGTR